MFAHLTPSQSLERAFAVARAARGAPFYAARFPENPDDWSALPILTRQELFDHTYPRSQAMLTGPVENMLVMSTGGSSGLARYTVVTYDEWDLFCSMQARTLQMMGLEPRDRVANLFIAGHLWPSFLAGHELCRKLGVVHLPISANIAVDEIVRLCREFKPTVLLSLPTLFIFLADVCQKEGRPFEDLRLVAYAGEAMSEQAQEHVARWLGPHSILPLAYTSADCGLMGYPCPHCGSGIYHLPTDFQYLEIVDGELLVTNLGRLSMPIIRYRVGDVGVWVEEPCPCGDPNPRFQLRGRAGEDFKIGGGFINMGEFDASLLKFSGAVSLNYQVEVEDIANQMDLRLTVESSDLAEASRVEEGLKQELCRRIPELAKGQEMGFIRRFEVRFVDLGALPRNPNTGKVPRLRDLRITPSASPAPQG